MLTILEFPDPRLRTKARPVAVFDKALHTLVDAMFATMYAAPGIGLAATQVNVHQQLLVLDVSEEKNAPLVLINPKIVESINKFGGKAVGISGRDVFGALRMGPQKSDSGEDIDIGFVGSAASINAEEVRAAIHSEIVPVISPIGSDSTGTVLNINADVAGEAEAVSAYLQDSGVKDSVGAALRDLLVQRFYFVRVHNAGRVFVTRFVKE